MYAKQHAAPHSASYYLIWSHYPSCICFLTVHHSHINKQTVDFKLLRNKTLYILILQLLACHLSHSKFLFLIYFHTNLSIHLHLVIDIFISYLKSSSFILMIFIVVLSIIIITLLQQSTYFHFAYNQVSLNISSLYWYFATFSHFIILCIVSLFFSCFFSHKPFKFIR